MDDYANSSLLSCCRGNHQKVFPSGVSVRKESRTFPKVLRKLSPKVHLEHRGRLGEFLFSCPNGNTWNHLKDAPLCRCSRELQLNHSQYTQTAFLEADHFFGSLNWSFERPVFFAPWTCSQDVPYPKKSSIWCCKKTWTNKRSKPREISSVHPMFRRLW